MSHRLTLLFWGMCCLTLGMKPALLAQNAPGKGVPASLNDLQLSEPPWISSGFMKIVQGNVALFAVLLPPEQAPAVQGAPAGQIKGSSATPLQRDAQAFAKRFNRWMHKRARGNSAMCAAVMARPPGLSTEAYSLNQTDLAVRDYVHALGYQWEILLAASAFEAGGGLSPGHYLVFDAKGLLRYNGPQEHKAELIMRTALREDEQEDRKAKR